MTPPVIELRDIRYAYRIADEDTPVLKGVSLVIRPGEMVAIQGPSGSGKSTLLYLIGCLLKPQSGSVLVDGRDVSSLSDDEMAWLRNRRIGFIFQQFHLLPRASVIDNIMLPSFYPVEATMNGEKARLRAEQLADQVGLSDRKDRAPNQLSGGQQQRVAIARALMNGAGLMLCDEPTGNLDSVTSAQIMELLRQCRNEGKAVVVITHDPEVAAQCDRVYVVKDGLIVETVEHQKIGTRMDPNPSDELPKKARIRGPGSSLWMMMRLLPIAFENLRRNKIRSFLTMTGITIGVSAVLAMVTLGRYTQEKILDTYAVLGVNTVMFNGDPNWDLKAEDRVKTIFRSFTWESDVKPLPRIFPQINAISPMIPMWFPFTAQSGGKKIDQDVSIVGVNESALGMTGREMKEGIGFIPYHVERAEDVCVIGSDVASRLFGTRSPVGERIAIKDNWGRNINLSCFILGVMTPYSSTRDRGNPNLAIYMPWTTVDRMVSEFWAKRMRVLLLNFEPGTDVVETGKAIQAFFERKYGNSGRFRVTAESLMITQMNKFLSLFTVMLAVIALVSLAVGGIGITNMMLVSVTERLKEIGLRKAVGATDRSIRIQFLTEAIVLCGFAGLIGMLIGFAIYQGVIFAATKFVKDLQFEWLFDGPAMALSSISILAVGILSGLIPAIRAEKLQVVEALRAE